MSHKVPAYCHFKPSDLAYITLGGKRHYLGKYGSPESREEYNLLLSHWLKGGDPEQLDGGDEIPIPTVADVLSGYQEHAWGYYGRGRRTFAYRIQPTLRDAVKLYGDLPADGFGPLKLKALRQHWMEAGCVRTTVNEKVGTICRAFRWAASCELISEDIHRRLKTVEGLRQGRSQAKEGRRITAVPDNDVDATMRHLPVVLADMIRIQRHTGARPGEVCRMRPTDIDRTGNIWLYRPASHKTQRHGIDRIVPLGPKAQAILMKYLLRDAKAPCFSPAEAVDQRLEDVRSRRRTPMNQGNKPTGSRDPRVGLFYTAQTYRRAIARVCRRHGISDWAPNMLRHSRATEVRAEMGYEAARTVLGHNTDITAVYAERNLELAKNAALKSG